ncbi:hypothetical protein [Roseomonas chloroacetimidivorans]|uniref:hypothetical protein n=1 Tax=Roseomonas chloroacetimidivorans TaxID=1766656 RepID=UPI003C72805D
MTRGVLAWAATAALILGVPPAAAMIFVAVQSETHLLDEADRLIAQLDAAEAAIEDLEPEEDDDDLAEVSLQPLTLCPDVNRPIRRMRGGRT